MPGVNWERLSRATGIVFVVLFVVAYIIYGDPPAIGASTDEIVSFYDDRSQILTATFIFGVAVAFLIWFAAAIASTLREAGKGGWGAATLAAGAASGGVFYVLILVGAGLANSIVARGDEAVITGLHELTWTCTVILSFPIALLIVAATTGLWRAGIVADWFGWIGLAAGVAVLLGGTTWATDGFWAADGAYSQYITPIIALAWIVVASALLYVRAPAVTQAPERAAVPTP